MKYKRLIVLVLMTLFGSIALQGQTESKDTDCKEIWELSCETATELLKIKVQYPLQIQRNTELTQQLADQKTSHAKAEKKIKRKNKFTKMVCILAIVGVLLIK